MTTVTGLTADRMQEIIDTTVVDGHIAGDDLILVTNDATTINAGNVRGPIGPAGPGHFICTSTTRPTYSAGEEGKTIYETDTNLVRIWNGSRFEIQGPVICTSATRPPSLVSADEGIEIYETDTGFRYFWNGTAWRRVAGDMGRIAAANSTTTVDCLDVAVTVLSITVNMPEERFVMLSAIANGAQITASSSLVACYVDSTGVMALTPKNLFYTESLANGTSIVGSICFTMQVHPGSTTFRLRCRDVGGGALRMQASADCQISMTDIGPA